MRQLSDDYFRRLVETHPRAIMMTKPNAEVLYVNEKFVAITGYAPDEILGRTPALLSSGLHPKSFYEKMWAAIETQGHWEGLVWNRRKNGQTYPQWLNINSIGEGSNRIFAGVFIDVGELNNFDSKLTALAYYDQLTQLPNRSLFCEILAARVKQDFNRENHFAVIFIDVDYFKTINDLYGHATGDKVLVEVAQRLKASLREQDILARLSGDEFSAILDLGSEPETLTTICERLAHALKKPLSVAGRNHYVSVSVGTSVFPQDGVTGEILLEKADKAMYSAKTSGRARVCAYNSELTRELLRSQQLAEALTISLKNFPEQFSVHYQPQYSLPEGRITGLEALIRWSHPELGQVSPSEFVPLAEVRDLVDLLTERLVEIILADLSTFEDYPKPGLNLAINISSQQIRDQGLAQRLMPLLERMTALHWQTEVEITETHLMKLSEQNLLCLKQLSDLGIKIAIDDFGTGYSSLAYLSKLPVDNLKIDHQFVSDISGSTEDSSGNQIVWAILALAKALQLRVIAEGIETELQLQTLINMNCVSGQGYLLAKPMPWATIKPLLL